MIALFCAKVLEKAVIKTLKELEVPLTPDLISAFNAAFNSRIADMFRREVIMEILVQYLRTAAAQKQSAE
jgi:hypothetical protein